VRAAVEEFATGAWRRPAELREHLSSWLAEHETHEAVAASRSVGVGRAMAHLHSAMIRRPIDGAAWDRQTEPGYRVAVDVWGGPRPALVGRPDEALVELVRQHLRAFGPANRRDIAWWSGETLGNVDAALGALTEELVARPGPDGQTYHDLAEPPPRGVDDPGVRLLPEFDALVLAYDPRSRDRFLDPRHTGFVWNAVNGGFSACVLADGRIRGSWRLSGSARERTIEVSAFPGERLDETEIAAAVRATEAALGIRVTELRMLEHLPDRAEAVSP
jgi:hypothetical protein